MKFQFVNKNLEPWNIYCSHLNPDRSVLGNVYIDNKEWCNSFLPPFFILKDVKKLLSEKNAYSSPPHLFSKENCLRTLTQIDTQLKIYFDKDKKISDMIPKNTNFISLLSLAHFGINFACLYFFPIEVLVTRKNKNLDPLRQIISEDQQAAVVNKTFSIDSVCIPMTVLYINNMEHHDSYKSIQRKLCDCFNTSEQELDIMFKNLEMKFNATKFMDIQTAQYIIDLNAGKLKTENLLNVKELISYKIQTLCGVITWSKYLPSRYGSNRLRHYVFVNILDDLMMTSEIKNNKELMHKLKIETSSGSEKFGKLIYTLDYFLKSDLVIRKNVLENSKNYAKNL